MSLRAFQWLLAVPALALAVAVYTLVDFIGSASDLRGRMPPHGGRDAAIGAEPAQESALGVVPAVNSAPIPIVTASVPTRSYPLGATAAEAATARSPSEATAQERAPQGYDASMPAAGEDIAGAYSGIDTALDDLMREERRTRTYTLFETAKATGDPDGSIRLLLQDAVKDPDSEIAYFARSALWQIQAEQDQQMSGAPGH